MIQALLQAFVKPAPPLPDPNFSFSQSSSPHFCCAQTLLSLQLSSLPICPVLSRCSLIFSSALCLSQKALCQITHAEASFKIKACTPPSCQSFICIGFNILVFENSPRRGRLNAKFQFHKFLQNTLDLDIWLFWLLPGGTLRDLVTFDCLVSVIKDTFAD